MVQLCHSDPKRGIGLGSGEIACGSNAQLLGKRNAFNIRATPVTKRVQSLIAAILIGSLAACGGGPPPTPRGAENVAVNRYLWTASLDVLSFLPVQSADPFTGVITTGFGTPPGGGRAYRATIQVSDPAMDARSLNLALQTRSGPVAVETQRAVEDAILSRARQLRIADGAL